ncbi:hypothetical protein [Massilia rubra]|uniref:Transmembrane protein n=1 Tax=Massilia rubra TaxID=2607910 RepID=A0ABX0LPK0_9BURK|nr:hypothetical protein [Massilia rubra]NHZ32121.1 hypothetical protein [Massilia rubra]
MHILRPLAILMAIFTIPAVAGWAFCTMIAVALLLPHGGSPWLPQLLPGAVMGVILLMGWVSLASLFWTARHFDAYISPTPRWVLAGYLFCALVFVLMLRDIPRPLPSVRDAQSMLTYCGGPACLLLLALGRLWHIRRFYAINIAKLHQDDACERDADGTLDTPSDHLATPCSSDPPASSH